MVDSKLITDNELSKYLDGQTISEKAKALYHQQINSWELAKKNYSDLKSIKKKTFQFDGFQIVVQFNPGRMVSSTAKVDVKSIKERPCFLCLNNLPVEQKGLICNENYILLLNPFPIFEEHFTIPQVKHIPQEIYNNFGDMLNVAEELGSSYTIFYNGPKCGASAPDHMHFQAALENIMPIENEYNSIVKHSKVLLQKDGIRVSAVSNYLRNFYLIESASKLLVDKEFKRLYKTIVDVTSTREEPLLNIVVTFSDKWRVFLFPRKAHRPKEFFAEGNEKILLSPASVDFAGLLITPREEDFEKITKDKIVDIFNQTTIRNDLFEKVSWKYSG